MLYYFELPLLELLTIVLLYLLHLPIDLLHILFLKNQKLLSYLCLDYIFSYILINFLLISYFDIMLRNFLIYQNEASLFFFFDVYFEMEFELLETFLHIEENCYYYLNLDCLLVDCLSYFDYLHRLYYLNLLLLKILLLNELHIHLLFYRMIMLFHFALIYLEILNADLFVGLYILMILYLLIVALLMFLEVLLEMKNPLFEF